MKYLLLLSLMLWISVASAQDIGGAPTFLASKAQLVKTYTNYTASSDDSTGILALTTDPVLKTNILMAREVYAIAVATDSVSAPLRFIGRNGSLTTLNATYADTLTIAANVGGHYVVTLKSSTINRLTGYTELKIATDFAATGQGTTAGRTLKWYLMWVR